MHLKATLLLEAGDKVAVQDYKQDANGALTVTQHSIYNDYPGDLNRLTPTRGNFGGFLLAMLHGNSATDATR